MKKKSLGILCACIAVLCAILFLVFRRPAVSQKDSRYTVKKEHREFIVEISGNIEAANEQSFNASADTLIEKIFFKEGDFVKKGQVMIQLDALEQEYNILNLEYQLEQKRITGAGNDIRVMEKQLEVLRKKQEDRQCIARFDGILAQLSVEEGEFVEAKDALGVLIDRSYLTATVEVAETDAAQLRIGQKVLFTFPAYSGSVEGYVSYIPSVGTITTRGATVVKAKVRIDNPPDAILTGFSFTGTIQIRNPEDVLIIPKAALSPGGRSARIVKPDGTTEVRAVTAEPYGDMFMEICSGLREGDTVVAPSNERSRNGDTAMPGLIRMPGSRPRGGSPSKKR